MKSVEVLVKPSNDVVPLQSYISNLFNKFKHADSYELHVLNAKKASAFLENIL